MSVSNVVFPLAVAVITDATDGVGVAPWQLPKLGCLVYEAHPTVVVPDTICGSNGTAIPAQSIEKKNDQHCSHRLGPIEPYRSNRSDSGLGAQDHLQ